ncbi:hypothetical protein L208DRAFT_1346964 [Tricholoma matsutake]|nr:hypothetical protein L208DRAFT_1346964 [Tricholoma matsutake 945]
MKFNFVPAWMTGLFQPCEVRFQCIFKLSLKKAAHDNVVQEVMAALKAGQPPLKVTVSKKIGVLRDRTIHWLWNTYNTLNKTHGTLLALLI